MADVNDSRDDVPDGCEAAASCFYCGGRLLMRFGLWRHDGPLYAERRHQPIPHPSSIVRRDMWTGEIRAGGGEGTP